MTYLMESATWVLVAAFAGQLVGKYIRELNQ